MDQVVDTDTAKEFMKETLEVVDADELMAICADVEKKSTWFRDTFEQPSKISPEDFQGALQRIFATRGKPRKTLADLDHDAVRAWITELLDGTEQAGSRLQKFTDQLGDLSDTVRIDLASELLHFARPEKHWLWTRWMWDPRTKTGSLPLVTTAAYDLGGDTPGEIYPKIGRAVAFVHEVGDAAGFQKISRNIFGTDVYLCSVYVVYAYTVLRMRMTNEFNKVMPGLPEFCRRLLGVHRKGSSANPSDN